MNKRPVLFSSACILSFLGGGLAALIFLTVSLFYNFFAGKITGITNELSMEGTSPLYFFLMSAFHTLSLYGIITMWKFRKNGFFLYLIAQAAIVVLPVVFIGGNAFSVTNAIFTLIFVSIFFFYYLWITLNSSEETIQQ